MKKYIVKSLQHPLISGSAVIFVGSLSGNFFHFLFNIFMSRTLSITEYGILASIMSLITLPSLLYSAFNPIIVTFAADYFANDKFDYVHGLYLRFSKISLIFGCGFFAIFVLFSGVIASFFNIHSSTNLLVIAGMMIFIGFISVVNTSLLQANLSFRFLALLNFLGGFIKFVFGVLLVYLGMGVLGGLSGLLISILSVYLISFIPISFVFHKKVTLPTISIKEILHYALPATCTFLSLTSFITTDILLVKHFYTPKEAGLYAGLALVGKVIFFFSAPIGMAMFPLLVQKRAKKENYYSTFALSMLLVLIPSVLLTGFYYLFPDFTVQFFLKNKDYLSIGSMLWLYGVYMTVYSLFSVMTNYFLSIKRTKIAIPLTVGAALQGILVWYYHSTFIEIILISLVIVSCLLVLLLFYYWYTYEKETN